MARKRHTLGPLIGYHGCDPKETAIVTDSSSRIAILIPCYAEAAAIADEGGP